MNTDPLNITIEITFGNASLVNHTHIYHMLFLQLFTE